MSSVTLNSLQAAHLTEAKSVKQARVGFIGAGAFVSAHHLITAAKSSHMHIRAIADLNTELLKQHAKTYQTDYTTTDYKELLNDSDIDIVIIGTKQNLHAKLIVESLDAGKWVFCEKPMAENEQESEAVIKAQRRNPGKLAIGFNRRFAPAYAAAKKLMAKMPRPWFINYRLMAPTPDKNDPKSFYAGEPRILYEGCHILDLVCWFLDSAPKRVFMTGDKYRNNCCLLDFSDGSQVSFMCGSMGSFTFWKEYMEVFSSYSAIAVSEFIDMRVRGFDNEYDRCYALDKGEYKDELSRFGFDWFEEAKADLFRRRNDEYSVSELKNNFDMSLPAVRRPLALPSDAPKMMPKDPSQGKYYNINPDKGWYASLDHFALSFLKKTSPLNADGAAGARSTQIALSLLKSLETGLPIEIK